MINCAASIDATNWEIWLDAVANMPALREVEVPAELLLGEPRLLAAANQYGLQISYVRNLLPPHISRYLGESPARGREDIAASLRELLLKCEAAGSRMVSLDLGLDRMKEQSFDQDLAERVRLLRGLIPAADKYRMMLCLNVRHPRGYPASKEWEYAANLVHEVMHPACRLAVNVFPAECPADFNVDRFVGSCYYHIGVIRFHYDPALGESLVEEEQKQWSEALHRHAFKGAVIFCPTMISEDGVTDTVAAIDALLAYYMQVRG